MKRLSQYTNDHFNHEEQVMQQHGYPRFDAHKALHDGLRRRTADLRTHADVITEADLLQFVNEWWLEHIQGDDKKYGPYLKVPGHS